MNRSEAKDFIRQQEPTFLQRARKTGYICPSCNNGSGATGDGIVKDKKDPSRTHYKCFKCGLYADIIDLVGVHYGIADHDWNAKFEKAFEVYGLTVTPDSKAAASAPAQISPVHYTNGIYGIEIPAGSEQDKNGQNSTDTPREVDYTVFFRNAAADNDYEYLKGRGISEEVQKRFMIGYMAAWISPQAIKTTLERGGNPDHIPTSPRCIIPTSRTSYIARDTREDLTEDQKRFSKQKQGATHLFNVKAFDKSQAVFITEGEIDAMSIAEAGCEAVGLGSIANMRSLVSHLQKNYAGQVLILWLDNDDPGREAQKQLASDLAKLDIRYIEATQYTQYTQKTYKDPNEALVRDPQGFRQTVSFLQAEALKQTTEGSVKEYRAADLLEYFKTIEAQPEGMEAKTGFRVLDEKLQGGLHEGLYIIGAISSLGKTTFTLQLADQIASNGQDVLFFSLEMSKIELMAKSISRYSFIHAGMEQENGHYLARDTAQIMNNRRYRYYTAQERETIHHAIQLYSVPAKNLYIYEGRYKGQRLTVQHIREITMKHQETTGRTPIVFVDYLQIIAPADVRATDKQNTDTAVFELKELSRDLKTAVFAISSFNRDNYTEPVNMASFKESGAVEYSSDVLFGLQYAGMDYQQGEAEKGRLTRLRELMNDVYARKESKEPIMIELKCLKNRNGYQFTVCYEMQAAFNHFRECEPAARSSSLGARIKKPI